ncbi:hypothetical protein DPMN_193353 [Dreissena polymorpha]|uniref:Integrase catalytic domain-containing protein n=1 Tax=Dreissena polymorpha TaxID=45954 RepID=A0A9D3Y4N8_DREPO|nr:hypothetical protein DPMN_193353 [Dreissena polymorpha]
MYIALRTVPVVLYANGKKITVNALLDDGSTKTYINAEVAATLKLSGKVEKVKVNTLNNKSESFETMSVSLNIESLNGQENIEIEASVLDNVTGSLQTIDWNKQTSVWPHLKGIHFPNIKENSKVDMLIGLDQARLHSSLYEVHGKPGEPIARLTPLGWTCVGPVQQVSNHTNMFSTYFVKCDQLDELVKGFWEIDNYGQQKQSNSFSIEDQKVIKQTEETMIVNNDHYEVNIPWRKNPAELPNNRKMAERRLKLVKQKIEKDPFVAETYNRTIEKYVEKGYLRKVSESEAQDKLNKWYLPHFPVVKPERETTKVRIVFDASAKYQGVSLNDTINTGPKLQNELFDVLLRFRKHDIALVCDISEMYLRVGIAETDRRYHRVLWDEDEYEFNTLVFGVNASPFLAQMVAQTNARKYADIYPAAAETVLKSTYMDDSMDSVTSEEKAIELYHQLSDLWSKAGMCARKWLSNSKRVLENIPQEDRALEVDIDSSYLPLTKALGIYWKAEEDNFTFKVKEKDTEIHKITKRCLLKRIASLFDPLGFITPYTVLGKIYIQKCWLRGYDWDEEVEEEMSGKIRHWLSELTKLNQLEIPRSMCFEVEANKQSQSHLHVFVDASEKAYGTVVYVRHSEENSVSVKFICSKSRVAPLSSVSIPRLELTAAVLGLRIALTVLKTLDLPETAVTYWTDSANVIYWIRNESRQFKPFVSNRIGEIHENSSPKQWRHVPGNDNPADLTSRGTTAEKLVTSQLWKNGPEFLQEAEDKWPKNLPTDEVKDTEHKKEQKKSNVTKTDEQEKESIKVFLSIDEQDDRLNASRYSDWLRLVRVYGWVKRFIENMRERNSERRNKMKVLTVEELKDSENLIIHREQVKFYPEEYKNLVKKKPLPVCSKLLPLNVKLDEDNVMRSDSRLTNADFLPYDTRFPVVLPKKSHVTKLLVKHYHEDGNHYGTNQTLAAMSARYWLMGGREEIRSWETVCNGCKRLKAKCSRQIMAPLPATRVKKSMRAFAYCSVDYAGPFITKQGRGKARQKRYLCLFTCLSTRAVHLEIAFALDTDSFLNAFYRMSSRRGFPVEIYSDNGTNFVGGQRELEQLDKDRISEVCSKHKVKWHFNPPLAPHFGGIHESMVKSAKRAIFAVLKEADVTDEELLTAITGAEGLINSRPISYQTANPTDETVLTPNHFLHGQLGGNFAPEAVDTTIFNINRRWRYVQEIVKHFWHRWLREIIPILGRRKKWHVQSRDMQVDDIVLVIEPDKPRGQWSLGRVTRIYPGTDGHTRVVDVFMNKSTLRRPISRLCLLDISES